MGQSERCSIAQHCIHKERRLAPQSPSLISPELVHGRHSCWCSLREIAVHFWTMDIVGSDFYIAVPSNASSDIFPDNTLTSFKVQLPQPVDLRGEANDGKVWKCGLSQIVFPHNLESNERGMIYLSAPVKKTDYTKMTGTIQNDTFPFNRIDEPGARFHRPSPTERIHDETGLLRPSYDNSAWLVWPYEIQVASLFMTGKQFVSYLNDLFQSSALMPSGWKDVLPSRVNRHGHSHLVSFSYNEPTKDRSETSPGLTIVIRDQGTSVVLDAYLAQLIGLSLSEAEYISFRGPFKYYFPHASPMETLSTPLRTLWIYSNVIAPYPVGNMMVPLLRIVDIPGKQNESSHEVVNACFSNIQYHTVCRDSLQTIEIDIRDAVGKPVKFGFGLIVLHLHLIRV